MKTFSSSTDVSYILHETSASGSALFQTTARPDSLANITREIILVRDADVARDLPLTKDEVSAAS